MNEYLKIGFIVFYLFLSMKDNFFAKLINPRFDAETFLYKLCPKLCGTWLGDPYYYQVVVVAV